MAYLNDLFDRAFDPGTAKWHLLPSNDWALVREGPTGEPLRDYQETLIRD